MSGSLPVVEAPMEECWRRIGVAGDRSCPELETFIHCRNCPVMAEAARTFFDREAPEGYLEAWSRILEQPEEMIDPDSTSVLVFRLDREWLALPATALVEVTPLRPLHRVPHRTGGVLEGLVNIRGQLQLCVSLHGLLGLEGRPTFIPSAAADALPTGARLLVIERSGEQAAERWVFGVDEVAGVHRAIRSALRAVPSTVSQSGTRHCQALFDWQGRAVGLLDESRVFDGLRDSVGG
jgi:chemotaxis-related protein WspD